MATSPVQRSANETRADRRRRASFARCLLGAALGALAMIAAPPAAAQQDAAAAAMRLSEPLVRSHFGEPLRVFVPIETAVTLAPEAMRIGLASYEEHTAAGLDRDALTEPLSVGIVADDGRLGVSLATVRPLLEPAVAVLLRIEVGAQRHLRPVAFLLDGPPSLASSGTAPPADSVAAPRRAPARAAQAVRAPRAAPAPSAAPATYGPTAPGDTLYGIAQQVRGDAGIGVRQMAMALFEANPHAFFGNDINNLRLGVTLRIPPSEVAGAVDRSGSQRAFEAQVSAWRAARAASAEGGAQAAPAPASTPPVTVAGVEAATATAAFRRRVAEEQAAQARVNEANRRLETRLTRLDERIAAVRALLDQHAARLQAVNADADRIVELAGTGGVDRPVAATEPSVTTPVSGNAPPAPDATPSEAPAAGTPTAPALVIAAGAAGPAGVDTSFTAFLADVLDRTGLADGLAAKTALVAIALLVALAAGWTVAKRLGRRAKLVIDERRFAEREAGLRSKMSEKAAQAADLEPPPAPVRPAAARARAAVSTPGGYAVDPDLAISPTTDAMRGLFREVDVYIAYGRFDDAAMSVLRALEDSPNQPELRIKLAEVHYEAGDEAAFVDVARGLYLRLQESGDEGLWSRVARLGQRLVPDERLFAQSLRAPAGVNEAPDYDAVDELAARRNRSNA